MRVLIVEDENATRALLAGVLKARGHEVTECPDAETGWAALQDAEYPLVLLNWMLPGMSGLDLCQRLRDHPRGADAVVLVITGRSESGALQHVLAAGADDYLPKPFDIPVLNVRLDIAEKKVQDHVARRDAEREQRRMALRVQRAERFEALGILAGTIAHDFNNMLVGVMGFTHLAMMDADDRDKVTAHLERIEAATTRASELTRQLLAYSGRGNIKPATIDLNSIAPEITSLVDISSSNGVSISTSSCPDALMVVADATQIRQVVLNLVRNGADAITGTGTIKVSTGRMELTGAEAPEEFAPHPPDPGWYAYVDVTDSGCGMDRATRDRMFDPCFSTKENGFGLGLAAALGMVQVHGGAFQVRTTPGRGTAVRLLLPLCTEARSAARATPRSEPDPGGWQGHGRVLVIDDDEDTRAVVGMMLTRMGFEVTAHATGEEGLDALEADETFVAVLVDLALPGSSGRAMLRRVRARAADVPVVITSGYNREDVSRQLRGSGTGVQVLSKPFTPADLAGVMQAALEGLPVG